MAVKGTIVKVSGPLIVASGMADVNMYDVVRVSEKQLIGEVIELRGDKASIQVYEETGGIGPGEPVESTGAPLSVELAPGLIESIYDGIQRPLNKIQELAGDRITRGIRVDSIDHERLWDFQPAAQIGDILKPGDILGTVQETEAVLHKIMVPPNVEGQLTWIHSGEANVVQTIAKLVTSKGETVELPMLQKWPVRIGRPYARKMAPTEPMITGQRVIDTLFPVAKGGVAAVPGPFGSGKTVVQHQLAKLAYARHFPAIDWLTSYSLYLDRLEPWFNKEVDPDWTAMVQKVMNMLQEESELEEIVRLVGIDALSYKDRLTLEATRSIREDYLHQNAFHEVDTYTSPAKQAMLLRLIIGYYEKSLDALSKDASFNKLAALPVREDIGRFKYTEEDKCAERYEEITAKLNAEIRELTEGGEA